MLTRHLEECLAKGTRSNCADGSGVSAIVAFIESVADDLLILEGIDRSPEFDPAQSHSGQLTARESNPMPSQPMRRLCHRPRK